VYTLPKPKTKKKEVGVWENFTMFGGDKLLEWGMDIQNSQDYPKSTEPNVDGYLTEMARGISFLFVPKKNLVQ
jgi:hypothetical protein